MKADDWQLISKLILLLSGIAAGLMLATIIIEGSENGVISYVVPGRSSWRDTPFRSPSS
jgi:hypothetical protein